MSLVLNPPTKTESELIAEEILSTPAKEFPAQLASWRRLMDATWDGDTGAILAAMGTRAADAFAASSAYMDLFESLVPGCTDDRAAKVRAYTAHEDGTVTLN